MAHPALRILDGRLKNLVSENLVTAAAPHAPVNFEDALRGETIASRGYIVEKRNIAREQMEQSFEERMAARTAGVEEAVAESLAGARSEIAGRLNQSVRRLRSCENDAQLSAALLEATQGFCDRAALFQLNGGVLQFQGARNVAGTVADFPLQSAPAFASAVESRDTVVAMRIQGEMSGPVAALLGEAENRKFYVFPVVARERVTALLYADADGRAIESDALELLATVAGMIKTADHPGDLVNITDGNAPPVAAWFSLNREEQDVHFRAQRYARVQVAEMRLYKSDDVKGGRTLRNLYASLRVEIDSAREVFRNDFLSATGTMVDYLHLELVRTLANNDAELLGPEYPGPLV
jgi:hypothetical protein